MKRERIDKLISSQSMVTRSEVTKLIRSGAVSINGAVVRDASLKIDAEKDIVSVNGIRFIYKEHIYIMLNKPYGVVSASKDPKESTVVELVPDCLQRPGLFPAGRLDKDTTGFVLITDDGDFAHHILSPKHHIPKTYLAETENPIDEKYLQLMGDGITIGGESFMPAEVSVDSNGTHPVYKIVICEGKYHQIKRMIAASEAELLSLKRIKMGDLMLDSALKPGQCRELFSDEISLINTYKE